MAVTIMCNYAFYIESKNATAHTEDDCVYVYYDELRSSNVGMKWETYGSGLHYHTSETAEVLEKNAHGALIMFVTKGCNEGEEPYEDGYKQWINYDGSKSPLLY
jgi:hypothetical protein